MTALPAYSVDDVRKALAGLDDGERAELMRLLAASSRDVWYSLPGPQSEARYSEADITGYGGAAGGGKTDLACGLSIVDHQTATIFRNEVSQLEGVKERFEQLLGSRKGFNGQTNVWVFHSGGKRRRVRFGGFPNLGDESRHQGFPSDLLVFDEAAEMREAQVRFVILWNRSARKGQRTRVLMTFNPPTRIEGRWIIDFFGPWLNKRHPMYPTAPGELRWVTTDVNGKDYWLLDGRSFVWRDGQPCYEFDPQKERPESIISPMSRTFIPARLVDNPFLMSGDYLARLQSAPEPLRSQMLFGDFEAGMKDDEWQAIPSEWIRNSMRLWKQAVALGPAYKRGPMRSLGVDVARGGRDKFVLAPRYGRFYGELIRYPGRAVTSGQIGAGLVVKHRRDMAPVHVDVIGYGASTFDALRAQGVHAVPVNVASGSMARAEESGMLYGNKRAELVWKLREQLNPELENPILLPDDPQLEQDLAAYRWRPDGGKIWIMSKDEMQRKLGRSPDDGDAVCLALIDTVPEVTMLEELEQVTSRGNSDKDASWELWFSEGAG